MSQLSQLKLSRYSVADAQYRGLYRLGGLAALVTFAGMALAAAAAARWPYAPGVLSVEALYDLIQADPLGGLMALDLRLLVVGLAGVPLVLALGAALKQVSESGALIGLVLGLLAAGAVTAARPVVEMVRLSDLYAAGSAAARDHYLAAGQALIAAFDGTAFAVQAILSGSATLVFAVHMVRSEIFRRLTGAAGLMAGLAAILPACGLFLPELGERLGFLAAVVSLPWLLLAALDLFRLARTASY